MNPKGQTLLALVPAAPDYALDWDAIRSGTLAPFFDQMEKTPQNPVYHAEGDVARHTELVCRALTASDGYRALDRRAQQIVFLAALLHDVGKPACTKWEDGRWTSPGHARAGMQIAREFLFKELEMSGTREDQTMREAICLLIRYHSLPPYALERENPERTILRVAANGELAPAFTIDRLCLLEEADIRGRICGDEAQMLESVALCRELAQDAGCLHGPGTFASAHTMRAYFGGKDVWREQALFDESWGEVVMLCALPGTGKDTFIRAHYADRPMLSLDMLRVQMGVDPTDNQGAVAQAAKALARGYLRKKQPFVFNATNLTPLTRSSWIELFEQYGAAVRVVFLETGWQEELRRNDSRSACVPQRVVEQMLGRLVVPERFEARHVEWRCV